MPYSAVMALYTFLSDKFVWYAWNLTDVVILIFSRAMYGKFQSLHDQGKLLTMAFVYSEERDGKATEKSGHVNVPCKV